MRQRPGPARQRGSVQTKTKVSSPVRQGQDAPPGISVERAQNTLRGRLNDGFDQSQDLAEMVLMPDFMTQMWPIRKPMLQRNMKQGARCRALAG